MSSNRHTRPLRLVVLLAIGAVLIATLVSFVNRWKGRQGADDSASAVKPLAGEVDQQTRAFSLAKTEGDHTLYTIKADQVTTLKETQKNLLHGVVVEIFGKTGTRHDRITTAECEYDPIAQTLWVPGNVEMSFELPGVDKAESSSQQQRVVIHTSQLNFDQSTGNATTDAPVDFTFPQGEGRSLGARYDSQQQTLHMVSAVEFVLKDQPPQAIPTTIHAGELRYFRNEGRIALDRSIDIVKGTRRVQSQSATVWLDEQNQVRRAELHGDVQASDSSEATPASVRAGRANLGFADGGTIRDVELLDTVNWQMRGARVATGTLGTPLREGKSQRMLLTFSPAERGATRASELDHAAATGSVQIKLHARAADNRSSAGQTQVLTGEQADMELAPGGRLLRSASLRGSPKIEMFEVTGAAPRVVTASAFDFAFNTDGELTQFSANQNVRVVSPVPATARTQADTRITTSENLLAKMDPATGKLSSLRQSGNFTYQDSARRAQAAAALYHAQEESISLERATAGGVGAKAQPSIVQPEGRIAGDAIKILMRSGDLEAAGAVATTSTPASRGSPRRAGDEPVHAVADKMRYDDAAQMAHYSGRVRLWQGTEFLLESETASLDRQNRVLTANGRVQTIFRPAGDAGTAKPGIASREPGKATATYVIRADQVDYTQAAGKILYSGNVRATQSGGSLTSNTLEIVLKSSGATADLRETASRIDKMIARGEAIVRESGREGRGDTAEYLADSKVVNLYGQPATLNDPARGSTKGVQLTYQIGDNRSAVVGKSGEQTETRWLPTK